MRRTGTTRAGSPGAAHSALSNGNRHVDIIQIEVDLPPSYPIFDKFIFDKVLIMLTSLPPLEFLTKIMKF